MNEELEVDESTKLFYEFIRIIVFAGFTNLGVVEITPLTSQLPIEIVLILASGLIVIDSYLFIRLISACKRYLELRNNSKQ